MRTRRVTQVAKKKADKTPISARSIRGQIAKLDGWEFNEETGVLHRVFTFPSYINALAFVAKVAVHAEILNHHPRIVLAHNAVEIYCTTHDAGTVTKHDIDLVKRIHNIKTRC